MAQKLKLRKALRVPLLKIQNACVNQLAMPTNLELTSSLLLQHLLALSVCTTLSVSNQSFKFNSLFWPGNKPRSQN